LRQPPDSGIVASIIVAFESRAYSDFCSLCALHGASIGNERDKGI